MARVRLISAILYLVFLASPPPLRGDAFVVTAVRSPGLGGTRWVTNVFVSNPADVPVDVEPVFYNVAGGGAAVNASPFRLGAQAGLTFDDVLSRLFSIVGNAHGPIVFRSTLPLDVTVDVSTSAPCAGCGFRYKGLSLADAGTSLTYADLRADAEYRTNIVVWNPSARTAHVTTSMLGIGTDAATVTLAPGGWSQIPRSSSTAVLRSDEPVFSMATVIQNATGHAYAVFPDVDRPALFELTLVDTGSSGRGVVFGSRGGLSCSRSMNLTSCSRHLPAGTEVLLGYQTYSTGPRGDYPSAFSGWTGCQIQMGRSCLVTLDRDTEVRFSFPLAGSVFGTIEFFRASKGTISAGETTELSWSSEGAHAAIDQGIGAVPFTGTRVVAPAVTTTYKLTVNGYAGEGMSGTSATVTVTVR